MRTTLAIDDDVLAAAKAIAAREHRPVGDIISSLARKALRPTEQQMPESRNGIPLLGIRADAMPVTPELVNQLRDTLP